MSQKVKVLISVVAAVVLLTVGGAATVLAQEPPQPAPQAEAKGLLAGVAQILGISPEKLVNAFKQARQEVMAEAFIRYLDQAVKEGIITEAEAAQIKTWWEQKPEALYRLFSRNQILGNIPGGKATPPGKGELKERILRKAIPRLKKWREPSSQESPVSPSIFPIPGGQMTIAPEGSV